MNNNLSEEDLNDSAILRKDEAILEILLKDQTTGTNSYSTNDYSFSDDQEITSELVTGWYEGFIHPRVDKDIEVQLERQRNKAELFTPEWVVKKGRQSTRG